MQADPPRLDRALVTDTGHGLSVLNVISDPNVARRFCTEPPLDFPSVFAPFTQPLPPPRRLSEIIHRLTPANVDAHHIAIAEWINAASPKMPPVASGATILMYAVLCGDVPLLQACVEIGADVHASGFLKSTVSRAHMMRHGFPPAFVAAAVGRIAVVEALCADGGATPMTTDRWGRTLLHAAAAMVNLGVILWLVDNTEIGRSTVDKDAKRALDYLPPTASRDLHKLLTPLLVPRCALSCLEGDNPHPLQWCHCPWPQPCSCPDSFFERWYMDRANTSWLPVDVALSIKDMKL